MNFSLRWIPVVFAAAALAACGGGGNSPTAGAPYVDGVVTGVAATGAAIVGGTVTLKCVSGITISKVTGTDGSFSIDVGGATLPCVGRVTYPGGTLHTFISAPGVANITPVTELLVARLTGGDAATAFDAFDASKAKAITSSQVSAAATAVKSYLRDTLGVNVTDLPDDPVSTTFKAASGAVTGDKIDKVLDDLKTKLTTAGKTLSAVAGDVVKAGAGTGSTAGTGSSSSGGSTSGGGGVGGIASLGSLVVSSASNAARNGTFAPSGALFTGTGESGLNAQTSDGKVELEVVWASNATIKRAHVWFSDGKGGAIKFFGCDGGSIPCAGVIYEPLMKQVWLTKAKWVEVNPSLDGRGSDSLVAGGESLTVDATLDASK